MKIHVFIIVFHIARKLFRMKIVLNSTKNNRNDIKFEIIKFLLYIESKGNNKCQNYQDFME